MIRAILITILLFVLVRTIGGPTPVDPTPLAKKPILHQPFTSPAEQSLAATEKKPKLPQHRAPQSNESGNLPSLSNRNLLEPQSIVATKSASLPPAERRPNFPIEDLIPQSWIVSKIAQKTSAPDQQGNITQILVVETNLKHPFLKLELKTNSRTGKVLHQQVVVANQLVVKLRSQDANDETLGQTLSDFGVTKARKLAGSKTMLLEFGRPDADLLDKKLKELNASDLFEYAEPNQLFQNIKYLI